MTLLNKEILAVPCTHALVKRNCTISTASGKSRDELDTATVNVSNIYKIFCCRKMCAAVGVWHQASAIALLFITNGVRSKAALYCNAMKIHRFYHTYIIMKKIIFYKFISRGCRLVTKISHPYCKNPDSLRFGA